MGPPEGPPLSTPLSQTLGSPWDEFWLVWIVGDSLGESRGLLWPSSGGYCGRVDSGRAFKGPMVQELVDSAGAGGQDPGNHFLLPSPSL